MAVVIHAVSMTDPSARLDVLERKLALVTRVAAAALLVSVTLAVALGVLLLRPLHVRTLEVTAANGARTSIEGGHIRLTDPSGNRATVAVTNQSSTVTLATGTDGRVAPEMVLGVNTAGTPASLLLSDRKARNFTHLYVSNGRAGLELAGAREYQNIASP